MSLISCSVDLLKEFSADFHEILADFCHDGSDFQKKLIAFTEGERTPSLSDGCLSLVEVDGLIIGWARSELWVDEDGEEWDTLEAFVSPAWRKRGIAAMAAMALAARPLYRHGEVAVFHPSMMLVARRAGILPTLFLQEPITRWQRYGE
jgi:hypothetical protein